LFVVILFKINNNLCHGNKVRCLLEEQNKIKYAVLEFNVEKRVKHEIRQDRRKNDDKRKEQKESN
jgi:hypothetical protein